MYLLVPFTLEKLKKKFLGPIQSYKDVPFLVPNWTIVQIVYDHCTGHKQIFFGTYHYYYFHLPIQPFHCAKFLKNSQSESKVMRMHHFWAPNGLFAPNKTLFGKKLLISFSSTYWPLSFSKIVKLLKLIQIYEDVPLLGPKYSNLS